ncbi:hypothetical protein GQ53DRAFT_849339 [Thozetella sp. PMI_491]|nr:hypothetical protein GQ53DRAFT_849339 [Thozetella sp. PMI_491]
MLPSVLRPLVWAATLAASVSASPRPAEVVAVGPQTDLLVRDALAVARQPHLEKREKAEFDITKTWKDHVLFQGSYTTHDESGITDNVSLAVTCVDCYTKGIITAKVTDEAIFDPVVRLDFAGVEAYVDMRVAMTGGATYSLNLFTSQSPLGIDFVGGSVGVVLYVDLVFSLTEQIDLEAGFYVKVADGAYLETSILRGDITKSFFDGLSSKALPVTVISGKATFKADLRVRVQCGAEGMILGLGAGAELGIYANLIEFVAILESTPTCALQTREWWDLNVGAYAHLDVVIDYTTIGPVPTVSTTLLSAPTATQCWIDGPESATVSTATAAATNPTGSSGSLAGAGTSVASMTANRTVSAATSTGSQGVITTGLSSAASAAASASRSASDLFSNAASSSTSYAFLNSTVTSVGPSASGDSSGNGGDLVTSTVYTTSVYTITSCAANVVHCPASYQSEIVVTQTIDLFTTVCPLSATITALPAGASTAAAAATTTPEVIHKLVVTSITDMVVLVPCTSPVVQTFTPPTTQLAPVLPTAGASVPFVAAPVAAPSSSAPSSNRNSTYSSKTANISPTSSTTTTAGVSAKATIVAAGAGRVVGSGFLTLAGTLGVLWLL